MSPQALAKHTPTHISPLSAVIHSHLHTSFIRVGIPQLSSPIRYKRRYAPAWKCCRCQASDKLDPSIAYIGLTQFLALSGGWLALRNAPLRTADSDLIAAGGGGGGGSKTGDWGWDGGGSNGGPPSEQTLFLQKKEEEESSKHNPLDAEVTIVIPALNEAACIEATIGQFELADPPPARVIVVDGGSNDGTQEKARRRGAVVVSGKRGRALQQNLGGATSMELAGHDRGILCFVHADTLVPLDIVSVVRRVLADKSVVLGGFIPIIEVEQGIMWPMSGHNFLKTFYLPLLLRPLSYARGLRGLFGDQVMFCRARDFASVGGFDSKLPLMEEFDLCVRLHHSKPKGTSLQRGRIRVVNRMVHTSGRRFVDLGFLGATYMHFCIGLSWYLGASPIQMERLKERLYQDVR